MMKKLSALIAFSVFYLSLTAQHVGTSPLEGNPVKYVDYLQQEKLLDNARQLYPLGSDQFYIYDTLSLPFIDDFSRDYYKSYLPWNNNSPVDSLAYKYRTYDVSLQPYALPIFPFPYQLTATYTYSIDQNKPLPDQVDSVLNPEVLWVRYRDSANPFIPVDTISVWQVTSRRYFYNSLNNTIDSSNVVPVGYLTTDTTKIIQVYFPFADDHSKWIDFYTYRNTSMGKYPPTIGVVTFDGTNEKGVAYNPGNISSYGVADYLTSKPIDLAYQPSDSVYLSFFYQPGGFGYAPGTNDSLVVDFRAANSQKWIRIWGENGTNNADTFWTQVMIPITDPEYLQKGFMFRFKTYGNLSGNIDHWNLDYVRLDIGRNKFDTIIPDVAYVEVQPTILRNYMAMPYTQFTQDEVDNKWINLLSNLDVVNKTISSQYVMRDINGTQLNHYTQDYTPLPTDTNIIQPYSTNGYATYPRWFEPDFNFNFANAGLLPLTDSTDYFFTHYVTNLDTDVNTDNDTILVRQRFYNYFAYDDGTAEQAVWLGFPGSMAVRFTNNFPDTLRAVQYYFSPIRDDVQSRFFDIKVWSSVGSTTTELYTDNEQIRVLDADPSAHLDKMNNGFTTYFLDSAVALPAGDFYVGWRQSQNYKINIGFDKNTDASLRTFFNTTGTWNTLSLSMKGSVMIRPVVGPPISKEDMVSVEEQDVEKADLTLFPNPASDVVYFRGTGSADVDRVLMYDMSGKLVKDISQPGALSFSVEGLAPGVYFVRFESAKYAFPQAHKIIVSR